ncbi:MAG TPA: substrate-binding domain-containing protein, partial [Clostridia bacterium]|nr:substrate-binding domain-containing protein [Clostridia bacterium]
HHVGVLMEDLGESYSQGLFYTLDHLATQDGVQISLAISYGDQSMERTRLRQLLSYQVDGLLVMPAHGSYYDTDLLRLVLAHFPVVLIDRPLAGIPAPSVYSDNVGGARKLTELLLQKGHTNIAYASTDTSETISLEDRYDGYVQTMRSHGLQDLPLFSVDKLVRFVASISRLTVEPAEPPEQLAIQ